MSEEKREWQVGDLCLCTYGGTGPGIIYRVMKVMPMGRWQSEGNMLEIVPAHGVIAKTARRGKRKIGSGWCTYLMLVDLGTKYLKFGLFIQEEAKRRGTSNVAPADTHDQ